MRSGPAVEETPQRPAEAFVQQIASQRGVGQRAMRGRFEPPSCCRLLRGLTHVSSMLGAGRGALKHIPRLGDKNCDHILVREFDRASSLESEETDQAPAYRGER
jgi:hypothetical protein